VGTKRSGPASGSDARNINEDNLRRNDDYHRQKKEREDGEWRRSDVVSSNANRRVYNGSERSQQRLQQQRGSSGFSDALKDQWQSGKIFSKRGGGGGGGGQRAGGRRRNDPWWMSDEERNNPRILPIYRPWWLESNVLVDASWKVAELRKEAMRRADESGRVGAAGVASAGYTAEQVDGMKKADLVELLVRLTHTYNLASGGFTPITFIDSSGNGDDDDGGGVPPCYPQVYEGGHDKMMALVTEAYDQILNNGGS
jgi:hypothetical protein